MCRRPEGDSGGRLRRGLLRLAHCLCSTSLLPRPEPRPASLTGRWAAAVWCFTTGVSTFYGLDEAALRFSPQGTSLRFIWAATPISPAASSGVTTRGVMHQPTPGSAPPALSRASGSSRVTAPRASWGGGGCWRARQGVWGGSPAQKPLNQDPQSPRGRPLQARLPRLRSATPP